MRGCKNLDCQWNKLPYSKDGEAVFLSGVDGHGKDIVFLYEPDNGKWWDISVKDNLVDFDSKHRRIRCRYCNCVLGVPNQTRIEEQL